VLIRDPANELLFSTVGLWEIAIKLSLGRTDFRLEPRLLRRRAIETGYIELPIDAEHCFAVAELPPLHRDPFDRLLIAQAIVEGVTLLTADAKVAAYPGPILAV
jgi:PIN domain nuclease of toxin-antitoxin system